MDEREREEGFKVRDRRRFSTDGEPSGEETSSDIPSDASEPLQPAPEQAEAPKSGGDEGREQHAAPIDFLSFVISLANTALYQLGLIRISEDKEPEKDLVGARQTIDLLGLMEEKTRGNLTDDEKRMLTETLFQLRMAFVEVAKGKGEKS